MTFHDSAKQLSWGRC